MLIVRPSPLLRLRPGCPTRRDGGRVRRDGLVARLRVKVADAGAWDQDHARTLWTHRPAITGDPGAEVQVAQPDVAGAQVAQPDVAGGESQPDFGGELGG